jgi:CheY-like chemotaxis protein
MTTQLYSEMGLTIEMVELDCRVLLADDYPAYRFLLRRLLEQAGAEVETAEHGGVATSLVFDADATDRPFDVVITDLDMPVSGGFDVLKTLRRLGFRGPVIAISSHLEEDVASRCYEMGFDAFICKTFASERLVPTVLEHHEKHKRANQLRN